MQNFDLPSTRYARGLVQEDRHRFILLSRNMTEIFPEVLQYALMCTPRQIIMGKDGFKDLLSRSKLTHLCGNLSRDFNGHK